MFLKYTKVKKNECVCNLCAQASMSNYGKMKSYEYPGLLIITFLKMIKPYRRLDNLCMKCAEQVMKLVEI